MLLQGDGVTQELLYCFAFQPSWHLPRAATGRLPLRRLMWVRVPARDSWNTYVVKKQNRS